MGNVKFQSPQTLLRGSPLEVFSFLSNLNNMEKLMPEQVIKWKSDERSCSFEIKGMAHIHLVIGKLVENELVTIESGEGNPIVLSLLFELSENEDNNCNCLLTLNAELGMMLQMMASTPLQNLVNIMADKLKEVFTE
jgi:hypothetical protein